MAAMIDYQILVDALTAWQAGATPPPSESATRMQAEPAQEAAYADDAGQPEEVEMMDSGLVEYEEVEQAEATYEEPAEASYEMDANEASFEAKDETVDEQGVEAATTAEGEDPYEDVEVEADDESPA